MTTIREILVDWSTPAGGGFRSVTYWDTTQSIATQRAALGTLLGTVDNQLDSNTLWTVETTGKEIDDGTGTLVNIWSETTAQTGAGATAGQCVPDAAMILLRWNTSTIRGGRFVKGRTYIPGLSTANVLDGNLATATVSALNTAVSTFVSSATSFGVWSRPDGATAGLICDVTTASVWSEFAVLRRRRG